MRSEAKARAAFARVGENLLASAATYARCRSLQEFTLHAEGEALGAYSALAALLSPRRRTRLRADYDALVARLRAELLGGGVDPDAREVTVEIVARGQREVTGG